MIYFQLLSEEESAHTCTKHSHTHTYTYTTTHIQTCTHTYKHTHTYLRTCTLIQTQMSKESCSIPTSNKQCPISCGHITQLLTTYLPSIYSHFSLSLSLYLAHHWSHHRRCLLTKCHTPFYSCKGKSTFFNAATCAALRSEDGRKMADVAPHPFTTIGIPFALRFYKF